MANPAKDHWRVVKWILRYFKGTLNYGLLCGGIRQNQSLAVGYVDSDYTGDLDNRRSLTGYIFTINNCTISWKSALQSVVALSTTEAEYTTIAEANKEAILLKGMVKELGNHQSSVKVFCDSQIAINLSKNQVHHEKTKHIDINHHFIRFEVIKGIIQLEKAHKSENIADMLAKPIPTTKFGLFMDLAGIFGN